MKYQFHTTINYSTIICSSIAKGSPLHPTFCCLSTLPLHSKCRPVFAKEIASQVSVRLAFDVPLPPIHTGLYIIGCISRFGDTPECRTLVQRLSAFPLQAPEAVILSTPFDQPLSCYRTTLRAIRFMQQAFYARCQVQHSALQHISINPIRLFHPSHSTQKFLYGTNENLADLPFVEDHFGKKLQSIASKVSPRNILFSCPIVLIGDQTAFRLANVLNCQFFRAPLWLDLLSSLSYITIDSSVQFIIICISGELSHQIDPVICKKSILDVLETLAIGLPILILPVIPVPSKSDEWQRFCNMHCSLASLYEHVEFLTAPHLVPQNFLPNLLLGLRMDPESVDERGELAPHIFKKLVAHLRDVYSLPACSRPIDASPLHRAPWPSPLNRSAGNASPVTLVRPRPLNSISPPAQRRRFDCRPTHAPPSSRQA